LVALALQGESTDASTGSPNEGSNSGEDQMEKHQQDHENTSQDDNADKAVERPPDKQLADGGEDERNWKRWMRLFQQDFEDFLRLNGILRSARRRNRNRAARSNVMVYLENDDRRARTFSLESVMDEQSSSTMMAPLHFEGPDNQQLFEGMVLQVDYHRGDGGLNHPFHGKLQIPACQDLETATAALYTIDTYQLLEPLHLELGISAKHAIDFAYTPVEFSGVSRKLQYNHEYYSPTALVDERAHPIGPTSGGSWWRWWFPFGDRNSFWKGPDEQYKMSETAFAGGSHGEVWRGRRLCRDDNASRWMGSTIFGDGTCESSRNLIFKRLKVEQGYRLLEAGLREVYLGKLLTEEPTAEGLFTTYVNHFFREVPKRSTTTSPWTEGENDLELWIVFEDAGPSLRSYLYSPVSAGDFLVYQHSVFWTKLRQSAAAQKRKPSVDYDMSISMILNNETQTRQKSRASNNTVSGRAVMKEILRQVLTSAAFLHRHGIVHR
jgi:hypothetical protein